MAYELIGQINPTDEWQIVEFVTRQETFLIEQVYDWPPQGFLWIGQFFDPNYAVYNIRKIYPRDTPQVILCPIPRDIDRAGVKNQRLGLRRTSGTLYNTPFWSIKIYELHKDPRLV